MGTELKIKFHLVHWIKIIFGITFLQQNPVTTMA